ncbi:MAG: class I SAM-dependent methyltransferase [Pleurocapsa sp. SU_196_0]|nr:class I SAM-dependent methyltransferase [Pleurocapsa sp. SU_196_0]
MPSRSEAEETSFLTPQFRSDLRTLAPDVFVDQSQTDWARLKWETIGKPYIVPENSRHRKTWEAEHQETMPVLVQWQEFNRNFHELFISDVPRRQTDSAKRLLNTLATLNFSALPEAIQEFLEVRVWNKVHRIEDAIWDPRGKRALFEGLEVNKPRILFLGAADGYEAMQLLAQYPGGHAVLVDYDAFCRDERFGNFPRDYPFLGKNPRTGTWDVHHVQDMSLEFVVSDIRDLDFDEKFDIVLSVGLLEHFPDEMKPQCVDWHRRFLKPGGYVVMTTPRKQFKSRLFYQVMGDLMNYGYRELMDTPQLGKYAFDNGLEILRAGYIKAHNGIVAKAR